MSATSLLAITAISIVFEAFPITSHRFITNPYPLDDWNSVLVSSDPIKILDKKQNETTKPQKLRPIIRARKRSFNDCPENDFKCLYGTEEDKNNYFERPEGLLSSPVDKGGEEKDKNFTDGLKSSNSRKSYWNVINPQAHHHPFDDKNGWVTLDPVPWSSSKISKWHPNMEIHNNFHWSVNPSTTQRPAHQFWISGSNYKPEKPNVQWGIGTNGLITDNKPSGFPTGNFNGFASHGINQLPFNYHKQPFQKFPQNYELPESYQTRFPQKDHPSTYPSSGNGEWVLLSTKKGYSQPNKWLRKSDSSKLNERVSWSRKIKPLEISRYHEEDLKDKKFSTSNEENSYNTEVNVFNIGVNQGSQNDTKDEKVMIPLQVYRPEPTKVGEEPTKTVKRKIRLQVLPSSESTTTSYNGLLEVDSNSQTVSEALEGEKVKKLQTVVNAKKNKIRRYKLVPINRGTGKGVGQKGALALAAVGAGMIPATMAILLPMALGRSKRSLTEFNSEIRDKYFLKKL